MSKKLEDIDYIKGFSQITITKACKNAGVNRSNLLNGLTTKENELKVRIELEKMINDLAGDY